jgi:hypothetical protein
LAKIVGFEVAPVTPESRISPANSPLCSSRRDKVSSQIETPASWSCWRFGFGAISGLPLSFAQPSAREQIERRVGVAPGGRVHRSAGADERHHLLDPVEHVDVHPCDNRPVEQPEREKLAVVTVAP